MKKPTSSVPRKAILLAAGFGSRMAPLSHDLPKAMMPLWGIPVLGHIVTLLRKAGVSEFLINLHHHPQPILDWCRQQNDPSLHIQLSFEPEILGTGGALRRASHFIDSDPFWMVNTDIAIDLDLNVLIDDFRRHAPLATLWMHATRGPRTVEINADGEISSFSSATPGADGTFTFCGLQLLDPGILTFLPEPSFCSVVDGYRRAIEAGRKVRGCPLPGAYWADLGTPARYLDAHRDIAQLADGPDGIALLSTEWKREMQRRIPKEIRTTGVVVLGSNVQIGEGATLTDCVLWDETNVSPGIRIASSIVGSRTTVKDDLQESVQVRMNGLPDEPVLTAVLAALRCQRGEASLTALPARGSDRRFERIRTPRSGGILVRYDDAKRSENARYATLATFLMQNGINVPGVILDRPDLKATLFEDAGTCSLQDALPGMTRQARRRLYRLVIEQLIALHRIPLSTCPPLEPGFDAGLYRWEHELFANHLLRDTLHLPEAGIRQALRDLKPVALYLLHQPLVPVHRDFQSSNVLLTRGRPVIIDFQGMRPGAAAYDLASLLCDPYVMLDDADRHYLLDVYCTASPDGEAIREAFVHAAVQRLVQALGAYGRLSANPATKRFERYITPALAMLKAVGGGTL